jgi:hypothetical protein
MRRLCLIFFFAATLHAQSTPLMLGVLEDTRGTYTNDPSYRSVRAVFYKVGSDWKPFDSHCVSEACLQKLSTDFPRETTWTIAFQGRRLGLLKTRIPAAIDIDARVGQQQILATSAIPTVGDRTDEFAGFQDEPVHRPLVAISAPNVKDPDVWKGTPFDAPTIALVKNEFRQKYPRITDCEVEELRDYDDIDIKILKSLTSKTGWRLVLTSLKGCDIDDLRGDGLKLQWFTIDPAGAAHYLQGNLRLVDAGDYDNSGHSQLLFMIDDDNRGGYVLYYNNFQSQAAFEYTFH